MVRVVVAPGQCIPHAKSPAASDRLVTLAGGLTVPAEPLLLLFDLQERKFVLTVDGDTLVVEPHDRLTSDDCRAIRRWKWHILALLEYQAPEVADALEAAQTLPSLGLPCGGLKWLLFPAQAARAGSRQLRGLGVGIGRSAGPSCATRCASKSLDALTAWPKVNLDQPLTSITRSNTTEILNCSGTARTYLVCVVNAIRYEQDGVSEGQCR
jgi:hypothetical protein